MRRPLGIGHAALIAFYVQFKMSVDVFVGSGVGVMRSIDIHWSEVPVVVAQQKDAPKGIEKFRFGRIGVQGGQKAARLG